MKTKGRSPGRPSPRDGGAPNPQLTLTSTRVRVSWTCSRASPSWTRSSRPSRRASTSSAATSRPPSTASVWTTTAPRAPRSARRRRQRRASSPNTTPGCRVSVVRRRARRARARRGRQRQRRRGPPREPRRARQGAQAQRRAERAGVPPRVFVFHGVAQGVAPGGQPPGVPPRAPRRPRAPRGALLGDNRIAALPASVASLRKLSRLDLSRNRFVTFGADDGADPSGLAHLAGCASLTEIRLDGNVDVATLPADWGGLTRLRSRRATAPECARFQADCSRGARRSTRCR